MSVLTPTLRRACAFIVIACAGMLAAGCGGVVGNGGTGITDDGGSGGTGTVIKKPPVGLGFVQGSVTGLGPLVVDGVHIDASGAVVTDDDGNLLSADAIDYGMSLSVQGQPVTNLPMFADAITVHSDLVGTVSAAYDAKTRRVGVLGQVVQIDANTVLSGLKGGSTGLAAGVVVKVAAQVDPVTGVYLATRIDSNDPTDTYATRGVPGELDTAAATFRVGAQVFDYAGVALPASFGTAQMVRVRYGSTPTPAGHWVVTAIQDGASLAPDGYVGDLRGVVGEMLGESGFFYVGGVLVGATDANILPAGVKIAPGMRVQVFGEVVHGFLDANQVQVLAVGDEDLASVSGVLTNDGGTSSRVDRRDMTFFSGVGSTPIDYSHARFVGGSPADLGNGAPLKIVGRLSPDGTVLLATRIEFVSQRVQATRTSPP